MVNDLNLVASEPGTFAGMSANYSGAGFAQMKFNAEAVSKNEFDAWAASVQQASASTTLDDASYASLADPGTKGGVMTYGRVEENLYNTVVTKFMDTGEMSESMKEGLTWPNGPERTLSNSHE